jgi:hypothetical protein
MNERSMEELASEQPTPEPLLERANKIVSTLRRIPKDVLGRIFTEDLSHQPFVDIPTDKPLTVRDIKKYYGAALASSYKDIDKALANGKPLKGLIKSSEGSRVSSDAVKNLKPRPYIED